MKQQQQSNLLSICLTYSCRHSNKHSYKMKKLWLMKSIRECIFFYHRGGKRKLSEKQLRLHFMQIPLNLSVHISQAPCFITKRTKSNSNQLIHMKYNKKKKIWGIRRWEVPSQVYKPSLNVNTSQISGEFIFKNMRKVTFSPSRKFPGQRNALGFARGSFWFLYL